MRDPMATQPLRHSTVISTGTYSATTVFTLYQFDNGSCLLILWRVKADGCDKRDTCVFALPWLSRISRLHRMSYHLIFYCTLIGANIKTGLTAMISLPTGTTI